MPDDGMMLGDIHFYVLRHDWLLWPTAHMAGDRTTCVAGVCGCSYVTIMLCNGAGTTPKVGVGIENFGKIMNF